MKQSLILSEKYMALDFLYENKKRKHINSSDRVSTFSCLVWYKFYQNVIFNA